MAHDELTPGEAALIEEYEALLADPSLWADVPAELEERVVDAITAEAAGATPSPAMSNSPKCSSPSPQLQHRQRWPMPRWA